ncbi:DUF4355 domain-containing protein [Limosilactobacillus caviae]|jgi:hypothetical protein|uniref:DUF4355 domain-containing protein n=1 Tax=Limosilactobacillus caviae TaxID=1769424 RepID=A0ABQ2C7C0_9LACO|nr:DUF4355 domain-containing protein [Limosilactobacillus caviae]MCD7125117.1 DUF4355 domain-containing protein [Limosilactobacillus caviae]MRH47210.1 DUF4355 domain-containing protein [Limosilactobacillus reuteri]GGI64246.1 hypothetical protein GCM10011459_20800 [Limosilactobacillus caviae]
MFEKLPMNLQFFADPEPAPDNDGAPEGADGEDKGKKEKIFTQAELDKIVQERLNRALKNKQQEIDNAKTEAAKLAKMNKDQKQEYKIQQSEQRAADAEAELARYKMRDTAKQQLVDGGYTNPTDEDIDLIVTDKAETTQERGEAFLNAYERIKEKVRQELLKGKSPRINGAPAATMTKAEISKIKDPIKRQQAIKDNLGLYNY